MSFTMSAAKRDELLNSILSPEESYKAKVWITIMASTPKFLGYAILLGGAGGALSNKYGYMGVTEKALNLITVGSVNVNEVKDKFSIPLNDITEIKVKKGLFGKRTLMLKMENESMKISVMDNAIGSDIKDQKENADRLFAALATAADNNSLITQ